MNAKKLAESISISRTDDGIIVCVDFTNFAHDSAMSGTMGALGKVCSDPIPLSRVEELFENVRDEVKRIPRNVGKAARSVFKKKKKGK